jgi:hypothetical protein
VAFVNVFEQSYERLRSYVVVVVVAAAGRESWLYERFTSEEVASET